MSKFVLSEGEFANVLRKAYESGWYGSKDDDEDIVSTLMEQLSFTKRKSTMAERKQEGMNADLLKREKEYKVECTKAEVPMLPSSHPNSVRWREWREAQLAADREWRESSQGISSEHISAAGSGLTGTSTPDWIQRLYNELES